MLLETYCHELQEVNLGDRDHAFPDAELSQSDPHTGHSPICKLDVRKEPSVGLDESNLPSSRGQVDLLEERQSTNELGGPLVSSPPVSGT